jgi:hypothetical protein
VIIPAAEEPGRAERSAVTDEGAAFAFPGVRAGVPVLSVCRKRSTKQRIGIRD